ncbi:hypothetical protein [Tsukamurella sp. NPDC003166]|uniref:hypothetical protein n=1 Tax=Tsukamurella sp. NPDC003166 TaxID=3154444 RepID=UPI0033A7C597
MLSRTRELHTNLPHTKQRFGEGELSPEAVPVIVHGLSHLDADVRRRPTRCCARIPRRPRASASAG